MTNKDSLQLNIINTVREALKVDQNGINKITLAKSIRNEIDSGI